MTRPRRSFRLVLVALSLAACDTGTIGFMGVTPRRVTVGEMVYDVRVRGLMAEALRQNLMVFPRDEEIALTAAAAMRRATGCEVLELRGDPSVVQGRLKCGEDEAPAFGRVASARHFTCTFERLTRAEPKAIDDYVAICV